MIEIRQLQSDDVQKADEILRLAFGRPHNRKEDLNRYIALQPDGWLLAYFNSKPVGMVGAIDYKDFAYVGMMGVLPEYQHRGIGQILLERLLAWIDERQIPMALLDASPSGYPLYLQAGFVEEDGTRQFERETTVPVTGHAGITVRPIVAADLEAVAEFDRPFFGADRRRVLTAYQHDFPERSFVSVESGQISGYVIVQERRIGPWVAQNVPAAEALLASALALDFAGEPAVILPTMNEEGAEMLVRAGFVLNRTLRHMRRGGSGLSSCRACIFGQVSFALG